MKHYRGRAFWGDSQCGNSKAESRALTPNSPMNDRTVSVKDHLFLSPAPQASYSKSRYKYQTKPEVFNYKINKFLTASLQYIQ